MFWMMNSGRNGRTDGFAGPMGMMSAMPCASMMTRMMPFMAGQVLASEEPEVRRSRLLEMVAGLVGQATSDMSDEEYDALIEDLAQNLRKREEVAKQTPADCCG